MVRQGEFVTGNQLAAITGAVDDERGYRLLLHADGDGPLIFDDNQRTVAIRMQQETVPALVINGASNCRQLVSGHKFTLTNHFNANGVYVITSISHVAQQGISAGGGAA